MLKMPPLYAVIELTRNGYLYFHTATDDEKRAERIAQYHRGMGGGTVWVVTYRAAPYRDPHA